MGLKTLSIDDSAHAIDALDVERIKPIDDTSMELPEQFSEDNANELANAVAALEEISVDLRQFGMTRDKALAIDKHIPGFYRKAGGGRSFTPYTSIEGLAPALEAVDGEKKNMLQRFWQWLVERFKAVMDLFTTLKKNAEAKRATVTGFNEAMKKMQVEKLFATFDFKGLDEEAATTKFIAMTKITEASDDAVRGKIQQLVKVVIDANQAFKAAAESNAASAKIASGSVGFGLSDLADAVVHTKGILILFKQAIASANNGVVDMAPIKEFLEEFKTARQALLTRVDVESSNQNFKFDAQTVYKNATAFSTSFIQRGEEIEKDLNDACAELFKFAQGDLKTALAKTQEENAAGYNQIMKLLNESLGMLNDIRRNYASLVTATMNLLSSANRIVASASNLIRHCAQVGVSEESRKGVKMLAASVGVTLNQPA